MKFELSPSSKSSQIDGSFGKTMAPDINMNNGVIEAPGLPWQTANATNSSAGASSNDSTESQSETNPWPPKRPDMPGSETIAECESQPFAFGNGQLYKFKNDQRIYKSGGTQYEFDMMIAAGDCSIRPLGRVFLKNNFGKVLMIGYVMERGKPLEADKLVNSSSLHKKSLMNQMISVVLSLHKKGIVHGDIKPENMLLCSDGKLRLCDFAEARKMDDDLEIWEGFTTDNYMSPHRCRNWPDGQDPPPTIEDDLYGLGLSIWEIFVGEMPFKDVYMDDILDAVKLGGTVDVNRVDDEDVREIIRKYLRCGGAKI